MDIARTWRCINSCNLFETVGQPSRCPHCGSNELYPQRESLRDFTVIDNDATPTRFANGEADDE